MSAKAIKLTYENCGKSSADYSSLAELKNKTILITGGTGFVGKWLTEMVCYLNTEHKFKTGNTHVFKNAQLNSK